VSDAPNLPNAAVTNEPSFRLIYRSRSKIENGANQEQLSQILRTSRANNAERGVTGALLMYDNWFAQVLEGPQDTVERLYDHIKADPRHDTLDVREARQVETRAFARWAMANVGEHGEVDIPLIATAAGIAESGARKTATPEQEQVLGILRDLTRGYGRGA